MSNLQTIEEKLQKVRSLLDEVARGLTNSDVPYRSADIVHVGEALAAISDIQLSIYERRPDLMPDSLGEFQKKTEMRIASSAVSKFKTSIT